MPIPPTIFMYCWSMSRRKPKPASCQACGCDLVWTRDRRNPQRAYSHNGVVLCAAHGWLWVAARQLDAAADRTPPAVQPAAPPA